MGDEWGRDLFDAGERRLRYGLRPPLPHCRDGACAVVDVPADQEDDVLAIVSPLPGHTIDPVELLEFLRPRLAHFMLPRYVRILDELPHTPTQKIEKYRLRDEGITEDAWDREEHNIQVRRDKVSL